VRLAVSARYVPRRAALGTLARLAAWAVAFASAYTLRADGLRVAVLSAVGVLVASTLISLRSAWISRAGLALGFVVVGVLASAIAEALALPVVGRTCVGGCAGALFVAALVHTRRRDDAPLDADVLAVPFVAAWLAVAAILVRVGVETSHRHVMAPVALVFAGCALLLACAAMVVLAAQLRQVRAIYRGDLPGVRVFASDAPGPALADVGGIDAALGPSVDGPYRGQRVALARVPSTSSALVDRYRSGLRRAVGATTGAGLALLGLVSGLPARAHAVQLAPPPVRALPGACATKKPVVRFAALSPLRVLELASIEDRYRGMVEIGPRAELAAHPSDFDVERGQWDGDRVLERARDQLGSRPDEYWIVVTDRDLFLPPVAFLPAVPWRYAFAVRREGIALVSVARMDPAFPWTAPSTWSPAPAACDHTMRTRAYKMITREIVTGTCRAPGVEDPTSVRRTSILSLDELDAIDETNF
jgi:hypothetical protein